ncbi:MAG: hypothetical protein IIB13_02670 [Chloroflexi bacterium]|nr:hypothetical protein [Chloroflexota bacterium]
MADMIRFTEHLVQDGFAYCYAVSAVDITGNARAIQDAFEVVRKAGRVSLVGLASAPVEIDITTNIIYKETRVFGSTGRIMWQTWWDMQNLMDSGKFDPLPVITHRMPMADFAEALDLAKSGQAGKILLYP